MNSGFVNKGFLNEFFLQLVSAYARRKAKEAGEKPAVKRKEKREEEKLERLPFVRPIRPFVRPRPKPLAPRPVELPAPKEAPLMPSIKKKEAEITKIEEIGKLDLNKIERLMEDPALVSVECYGPNEKIKIKRDNQIGTAESLTSEEIKSIIESISKKTKVPIGTIFRASFDGIAVDAIISSIIGPRFIVTKLTEEG